eukprot:CAMPEP_0196815460 /NCGR_PEP_ID=MMETSP1362-20130617/49920_1 /TAXON_ID=163516 /ORGANISM="Leptocylindrus danicus, Strain CCMP1856" /LENGTH=712 /DNA_ID=CAMNT_0042192425 /DNA_START=166 /DNA_END=2304 /DNA_ORIENTATION=-
MSYLKHFLKTFTPIVLAQFPRIKWLRTIPNGGTLSGRALKKGNGIVPSIDDRLWAAADDGHLLVFNQTNGDLLFQIDPKVAQNNEYVAWTESRSSVALHYNNAPGDKLFGDVAYCVYALLEVATTNTEQSRIVAINGNGTFRWSQVVEGTVEGTPAISADGENVYVARNVISSTNVQNPTRRGAFTIINDKNQSIIADFPSFDSYPFGPLSHIFQDGSDILYWADPWKFGYAGAGSTGIVYRYDSSFGQVSQLQEISLNAVTAPMLGSDGRKFWLGGSNAQVVGWISESGVFDETPAFTSTLERTDRNKTAPLHNRPIATNDGQYLFVASTSPRLYCLDGVDGKALWTSDFDEERASIYMTEARLSRDESNVYFIRHRDGAVENYDAKSGQQIWEFSCRDISDDSVCEGSVEAQFDLSADKSVLFFGNIFGQIVALEIGESESPVQPFSSPTPVHSKPSTAPSIQVHNLSEPTFRPAPSISPSKGLTALPSSSPTTPPTKIDSKAPSFEPTLTYSMSPSPKPSVLETSSPSEFPTVIPTFKPSERPTSSPSMRPSISPSHIPSSFPTDHPSDEFSLKPTKHIVTFSPSPNRNSDPASTPSDDSRTEQPTNGPQIPSVRPTPQASSYNQPQKVQSEVPTNDPIDHSLSPFNLPSVGGSAEPTIASPIATIRIPGDYVVNAVTDSSSARVASSMSRILYFIPIGAFIFVCTMII